jgi:aspartate/methionine/tyrosine aminotransferase
MSAFPRAARLATIAGFGIDAVAAAAEGRDVLRLENLDTDVPPSRAAMDAARAAVGDDEYNSYLPFTGRDELKAAIAAYTRRRSGAEVDPATITITGGEGDCMLNGLLTVTDPGDEVIVTDPTYAGMINRVRLAGCTPRPVPLQAREGAWRLDLDALSAAASERTRAIFLGNPSFPTGFRADEEEWEAICTLCRERDLWLLYWSCYEGVVFDGAAPVSPLSFDGMAERTVVMGSASMEQRLIGYRVGWTFGPAEIAGDLAVVHIYNAICPGGIGQAAATAAFGVDDLDECVAEWQRRRDAMLEQLDGLPIVRADGAWSMCLDAEALGFDSAELSRCLLEQRIAATPMKGWGGPVADRQVRFVFSNEPVERLGVLGERVRAALA